MAHSPSTKSIGPDLRMEEVDLRTSCQDYKRFTNDAIRWLFEPERGPPRSCAEIRTRAQQRVRDNVAVNPDFFRVIEQAIQLRERVATRYPYVPSDGHLHFVTLLRELLDKLDRFREQQPAATADIVEELSAIRVNDRTPSQVSPESEDLQDTITVDCSDPREAADTGIFALDYISMVTTLLEEVGGVFEELRKRCRDFFSGKDGCFSSLVVALVAYNEIKSKCYAMDLQFSDINYEPRVALEICASFGIEDLFYGFTCVRYQHQCKTLRGLTAKSHGRFLYEVGEAESFKKQTRELEKNKKAWEKVGRFELYAMWVSAKLETFESLGTTGPTPEERNPFLYGALNVFESMSQGKKPGYGHVFLGIFSLGLFSQLSVPEWPQLPLPDDLKSIVNIEACFRHFISRLHAGLVLDCEALLLSPTQDGSYPHGLRSLDLPPIPRDAQADLSTVGIHGLRLVTACFETLYTCLTETIQGEYIIAGLVYLVDILQMHRAANPREIVDGLLDFLRPAAYTATPTSPAELKNQHRNMMQKMSQPERRGKYCHDRLRNCLLSRLLASGYAFRESIRQDFNFDADRNDESTGTNPTVRLIRQVHSAVIEEFEKACHPVVVMHAANIVRNWTDPTLRRFAKPSTLDAEIFTNRPFLQQELRLAYNIVETTLKTEVLSLKIPNPRLRVIGPDQDPQLRHLLDSVRKTQPVFRARTETCVETFNHFQEKLASPERQALLTQLKCYCLGDGEYNYGYRGGVSILYISEGTVVSFLDEKRRHDASGPNLGSPTQTERGSGGGSGPTRARGSSSGSNCAENDGSQALKPEASECKETTTKLGEVIAIWE